MKGCALIWTCGSAESLALISNYVAARNKRKPVVCLPAYFCGQSIRYLRGLDVELAFYPLTDELLPDYERLERYQDSPVFDVLVHVHFFGRVSGADQSAKFAKSKGAILIEDAAHCLEPDTALWRGDFVLMSPHKHFGTQRAGMLFAREALQIKANDLWPSEASASFDWLWLSKQIIKKIGFRSRVSAYSIVVSSAVEMLQRPMLPKSAVNLASRAMLRRKEACLRRQKNLMALNFVIRGIDGWRPLLQYDSTDVPYIYGLLCDSEEIASHRYGILNRHNALVQLWPDLPAEVVDSDDYFAEVRDVVSRTLFFSLHQDLEHSKWVKCIRVIVASREFQGQP